MSEEQINFLSNSESQDKNLILMKITENEEKYDALKKEYGSDFVDHLHCSGCINRCSLSSPVCGRGHTVRERILKFEEI